MLFTKASEYALLSLIYIASKDKPQDVDCISNELGISKSFLAKILQNLAKDNLLISYKGAKGGFCLSKSAKEYSIKEIINSAEKKQTNVFDCSCGICPNEKHNCLLLPVLTNLQNKIDDYLDSISLEDVINGKNQ